MFGLVSKSAGMTRISRTDICRTAPDWLSSSVLFPTPVRILKKLNLFFLKKKTIGSKRLAASLLAAVAGPFLAVAQQASIPRTYVCYQSAAPLTIDGKLSEKSWKMAPWTTAFVDIEGDAKPRPLQKTRAKLLWDNQYLYIGAEMAETHIWAYQDRKDQIVYLENDFEVFIDPDGDTDNYYELEINAINNSFDLFLPKPYRKGGRPALDWDIVGLKSAVTLKGTVNKPTDQDKSWTLEIATPLTSLSTRDVAAVLPQDGSVWRINFSRVNWQHDVADGKYSRRKNPETGKVIPEYNWVWSPQGVINMHIPEYWGLIQFSTKVAGKKRVPFTKTPPVSGKTISMTLNKP